MITKLEEAAKLAPFDILAFGPHPDDVEAGCSGLLINSVRRGYSVAICDLTRGELSTNGTVEERQREALKAAGIIGAKARVNTGLPNNFLFNTEEHQRAVIRVLRTLRPRMVLLPETFDRHPDHENAPKIIRDAIFTSGLHRYEVDDLPAFRPTHAFAYPLWYEGETSFIVDVSEAWEKKLEALYAHESQFTLREGSVATIDTSDSARAYLEAQGRRWGFMIGRTYGEAYRSIYLPVGADDPLTFLPNVV
jgi:bacillithiol biosynthesis deacetylase BshB1